MKHLKVLEDNDLVVSFEEKSTLGGPPRKSYVSKKRISLRIDVGPNTFNSEVYDYRMIKDKNNEEEVNEELKDINGFVNEYTQTNEIKDSTKKLSELSKLIHEINNELESIKIKRAKLLNLKEQAVRESNKIILGLCDEYDERKILYYILTHPNWQISDISEVFEMREKVIEEIFRSLIRHRIMIGNLKEFF